MDISSSTTSLATSNTTASAASTSPTSDFDTFLRLLTAQIRNQDPLEPADSTAYTAQLATFSNVEQSVKTNDLLAQMIQRLDTQQISGASDWIGMEVRSSGPIAHQGGETELHTRINAVADRADLVALDAQGAEVARQAIDPDGETLRWPGMGLGNTVPDGIYTLQVEAWAGERQLDTTAVDHYAQVTEVVLGASGTDLVLNGGIRLPADQLQSIRRPVE